MEIFMTIHPILLLFNFLAAIFTCFFAYRNNHVNLSGALILLIALPIHFIAGFRYGVMLLVFLLASFWMKSTADPNEQVALNWTKLLPHCGFPLLSILMILYWRGWEDKCVDWAQGSKYVVKYVGHIVGHYGFGVGDNWTTNSPPAKMGVRAILVNCCQRALGGIVFVLITFVNLGYHLIQCSTVEVQWFQLSIALVSLGGIFLGCIIHSSLGARLHYRGKFKFHDRDMLTGEPGPNVTKVSGLEMFDKDFVDSLSTMLTGMITSRLLEQAAFHSDGYWGLHLLRYPR